MMEDVRRDLDVSRETLDRLKAYAEALARWNKSINLVAPSTIADLWDRHIVDSAQLMDLAPSSARRWVDLGSGGGLPGMVCAILAAECIPDCEFTLIESDRRKSAFLMATAQTLGLKLTVLAKRVEEVPPLAADIVSARALAPLPQLLGLVARHLHCDGVALLPKGKTYEQELAAASAGWHFTVTTMPSRTDNSARVLIIKDISRG